MRALSRIDFHLVRKICLKESGVRKIYLNAKKQSKMPEQHILTLLGVEEFIESIKGVKPLFRIWSIQSFLIMKQCK